MRCPRCKGKMKVTHSYTTDAGRSQRLECKCGLTATAVSVIVAIDPETGQGVGAYVKKLQKEKAPPSVVFASEDGTRQSSGESPATL